MGQPARPPIKSEFSDEPELLELIGQFAAEMPRQARALEAAWTAGRRESLRALAREISSAAGGYGFGIVGDTAAELEERLAEDEATTDELRDLVMSLVDLCQRVRAG